MRRNSLLALIVCGCIAGWTLEPVFAAGGQNQGETGSGETSTGSDAQGEAEQDRAGRGDSLEEIVLEEILGG